MQRVRTNLTLKGEPVEWLKKWEERGLVTSCRDAVVQSFRVFEEKLVEQDLKATQLKTLVGRDEVG